MNEQDQIARAVALFKSFRHRDPRDGEIVKIDGLKELTVALELGPMVGIAYRADRDGKEDKYYHEFERTLPRVFVAWDGLQIFVVGGSFKYTDVGFVG